jgi:hypothetical protein
MVRGGSFAITLSEMQPTNAIGNSRIFGFIIAPPKNKIESNVTFCKGWTGKPQLEPLPPHPRLLGRDLFGSLTGNPDLTTRFLPAGLRLSDLRHGCQ